MATFFSASRPGSCKLSFRTSCHTWRISLGSRVRRAACEPPATDVTVGWRHIRPRGLMRTERLPSGAVSRCFWCCRLLSGMVQPSMSGYMMAKKLFRGATIPWQKALIDLEFKATGLHLGIELLQFHRSSARGEANCCVLRHCADCLQAGLAMATCALTAGQDGSGCSATI